MKVLVYLFFLTIFSPIILSAQNPSQFRGPFRTGVYLEQSLLKEWPKDGPHLMWSAEDIGKGYSSVSVNDKIIYVTGKKDSMDYLTAISDQGEKLWTIPYGVGCSQSFPETRCTPTVEGDFIYLISGSGQVVCVNKNAKVAWTVNAYKKYDGKSALWEIAESPLLVDDKVIYTPGGFKTTMIALDKRTGELIWQTQSLQDSTAYVSPILVEWGKKKIIVSILRHYIIGVNADNGDILWSYNYSALDAPTFHPEAPFINCDSPIYSDGHIFVTSGYDHTAAMFKLSQDGNSVKLVWKQPVLDTHHGGVVLLDGYLYGSNWLSNSEGNWVCLDWNTGKVMYEKEWQNKGSIITADNMIYIYEEKRGNVALVAPSHDDFQVVSFFRIKQGSGSHWAHPVINEGILYIRHGDVVMAYNIRK